MFALVALICFIVAQFEERIGFVSLLLLGLSFIALHLMVGWPVPWRRNVP